MTQEVNNEIDLLLRRLSRSASDSSSDGNHLDADELSSYAENALPAAARARYTEHLAECASCRKLVAQLSSSIGAVSVTETAKVSAPSALRQFLASLLSPMVLRYAVPALGLIVVAVIGLTVLRRNERPAESVAQVVQQEQREVPAAQPEQAKSPASDALDKQAKVGSPAATTTDRSERAKETQPAPPPASAPSSASETAGAFQTAPVTKQEQQQPVANEPTAPKPTPAADENQKKVEAEARKQETQVRAAADKENAYTPSTGEARRIDDIAVARAPAKAAGPASMAKVQRERSEEKDKSDADTRSVAGRRFRRERGIWIDTAYDSSRSTFSLTRGSEQYRTLVADEPAIKTIAEQLDGEIIVVWKGRAYHIQ